LIGDGYAADEMTTRNPFIPYPDDFCFLPEACARTVEKIWDLGVLSDEFVNNEIVPLLLEPIQLCYVTPFCHGLNYPPMRPEFRNSTCVVALVSLDSERTIKHILLYKAKGYTRFEIHIRNNGNGDKFLNEGWIVRNDLQELLMNIVRLVGRENLDFDLEEMRYFPRHDNDNQRVWYERVVADSGWVTHRVVGPDDPRNKSATLNKT